MFDKLCRKRGRRRGFAIIHDTIRLLICFCKNKYPLAVPRTRDCCTYVCNTIVRESWYMCKNDVKSGLMDVTCDLADKGNWPYNRKLTPKIPSNYTKPSSTLYYFKLWTSLQCEEVPEVLTATLNCRTPALSLKITRSKQPIWLNWPCQLAGMYL